MRIVLGVLLALSLAGPVTAQTYLTSTTTAAAVSATDTTISVASASGIVVGGALYLDREWMSVRAVSGTRITVQRGQGGTVQNSHGTSRTIVIIPLAAVAIVGTSVDPTGTNGVGTCTPSQHQFLPYINLTNGNLWTCRAISGAAPVWAGTNNVLITYNSLYLGPG